MDFHKTKSLVLITARFRAGFLAAELTSWLFFSNHQSDVCRWLSLCFGDCCCVAQTADPPPWCGTILVQMFFDMMIH